MTPFQLTPAQRDEYRREVAKSGSVLQAKATLQARYAYQQPKWWKANKTAIKAEWDLLDKKDEK